jgi:biotin carboxyl carrier protein
MVDTNATDSSAPASSEPGFGNPPPAAPRPPGATFRKWRARFIVLLLLVAAVFAVIRVTHYRTARASMVDLGTVTLTTQVVPVETPRPGQVMTVDVRAEQNVSAGTALGTIQVTTTNSEGKPVISLLTVSAPRTGIVVDDPVTVGSTLQPGQPFVKLYDPTELRFTGEIPLKDLPVLSAGMTATLTAEGLSRRIKATVQRVVPRVGDNQTDVRPGYLKVVLVPKSEHQVQGLVPGLRFTGSVDTRTGNPDNGHLVSLGRAGAAAPDRSTRSA